MASRSKAAAVSAPAPGEQAVAVAIYDVKLNARFDHDGFLFLPGQVHHVDKTIFAAMKAKGVVEDVVELS